MMKIAIGQILYTHVNIIVITQYTCLFICQRKDITGLIFVTKQDC